MSDQARRIAELESTLAGVRHNENVTQNMDDLAGNINRSDVSIILSLTILSYRQLFLLTKYSSQTLVYKQLTHDAFVSGLPNRSPETPLF